MGYLKITVYIVLISKKFREDERIPPREKYYLRFQS